MAPAITHFLVGASLLLYVALIALLRYEFPVEHTLWVVPIGGVWGVVPDFHHIAPAYNDALYAFHASPWVEVFALHYTLDRAAIRAQYHESIFAAIAVFTVTVASVWIAARYRTVTRSAETRRERAVIAGVATVIAAGLATIALGVTISIHQSLGSVAALVGLSGVYTGWVITGVWGVGVAWLWTIAIEVALLESRISAPVFGAGIGCLGGVATWLTSAIVILPILTSQSVPVVHWGGLAALLTYGTVFGAAYTTLRSAFTAPTEWTTRTATETDTHRG
ncbi:hypothetical protein GCM10008995_01820 [Halobellus salinus]|uniref:Uncharacterized protein n=1 Tax=Halobellus salinus TaxID=931585 RepID=A0A830EBG2_9EURY|nr:hypothetical protein [Halobellus salinus]GGI95276.1 hypothetical protein GCM10008995_01820 [Halobellus salinus]SMP12122.1 hypothetical protein SAMN06265347_10424 [Halobellus salinus]